jgi:hypothetical protein
MSEWDAGCTKEDKVKSFQVMRMQVNRCREVLCIGETGEACSFVAAGEGK